MRALISALDALLDLLRAASLALVVIGAILAALAWAVRARHLNPFGGVARFVRRGVEPLLTPFDRRLARHGIVGPSVPWWAVLLLIMACATAIFVVGFARDALMTGYLASNAGPRGLVFLAVRAAFGLLQLALLVRVVTSWVGGTYSSIGRLATRLTEWFIAPLRRVLPTLGAVDISPIVAWFLLGFVERAFLTLL